MESDSEKPTYRGSSLTGERRDGPAAASPVRDLGVGQVMPSADLNSDVATAVTAHRTTGSPASPPSDSSTQSLRHVHGAMRQQDGSLGVGDPPTPKPVGPLAPERSAGYRQRNPLRARSQPVNQRQGQTGPVRNGLGGRSSLHQRHDRLPAGTPRKHQAVWLGPGTGSTASANSAISRLYGSADSDTQGALRTADPDRLSRWATGVPRSWPTSDQGRGSRPGAPAGSVPPAGTPPTHRDGLPDSLGAWHRGAGLAYRELKSVRLT